MLETIDAAALFELLEWAHEVEPWFRVGGGGGGGGGGGEGKGSIFS